MKPVASNGGPVIRGTNGTITFGNWMRNFCSLMLAARTRTQAPSRSLGMQARAKATGNADSHGQLTALVAGRDRRGNAILTLVN
jgi:hypothetical protein